MSINNLSNRIEKVAERLGATNEARDRVFFEKWQAILSSVPLHLPRDEAKMHKKYKVCERMEALYKEYPDEQRRFFTELRDGLIQQRKELAEQKYSPDSIID